MQRFLRFAASALLALLPWTASAAGVDPDLLAGLAPRSIGPAAMSGRVPAVDVVESNPDIIYVGAAAGGVWKSVNGGLTWTPVFDDQPVASIGAIADQPGQSGRRLGGHRRGQPAQQRLDRRRRLPLARRRPDLDPPGAGEDGAHPPHRAPSHRPERRLGGGPRPGLGGEPRARGLQDRSTAARPGARCSTSTRAPAPPTW